MAYTKYSLTPANNTATPPDGAPEGMLPSAVNDTMRDMMAQIRDVGDGIRDGTYTMTAAKITGGTITGTTFTGNTFSNPTITGVSTFAAGTVSAPAITTTGDTNTGIFFPAADTIAFTEGGAEAMRIDSSGNVGIGTSSPSSRLHVKGTDVKLLLETSSGATSYIQQLSASPYNVSFYNQNAGSLIFGTSDTERMRIDSSGNVGIGTSSPNSRLNVSAATSTIGQLRVDGTGTGAGAVFIGQTAGSIGFMHSNAGTLAFGTSTTDNNLVECMRITSGGEVYIAGTTDQGAYNLQVNGTGVWGAGAYVNGSDKRIKDNIAPIDSGLDVVTKLNPVTYKYKEDWSKDQSTQTGFIAQELLTALEGKNYIDGVVQQGGEYMSVAYQNIIPILAKAIQEQQEMIEELKQEVAALKASH